MFHVFFDSFIKSIFHNWKYKHASIPTIYHSLGKYKISKEKRTGHKPEILPMKNDTAGVSVLVHFQLYNGI